MNDGGDHRWHASKYADAQERILLGDPLDQRDVETLSGTDVEALADFCRMTLDTRPPYDPVYEAAASFLRMTGRFESSSSAGGCEFESDNTYCPIPGGFSEQEMRDATSEELYDLRGQVDYAYNEGLGNSRFTSDAEVMAAGRIVYSEINRRLSSVSHIPQDKIEFEQRIGDLETRINGLKAKLQNQRAQYFEYIDALNERITTLRDRLDTAASKVENTLSSASATIDARNAITGVVIANLMNIGMAALAPEVVVARGAIKVLAWALGPESVVRRGIVAGVKKAAAAGTASGSGHAASGLASSATIASPLTKYNIRGNLLRDLDIKGFNAVIEAHSQGRVFADAYTALDNLQHGTYDEEGKKDKASPQDLQSIKGGGVKGLQQDYYSLRDIELAADSSAIATDYFDKQGLNSAKIKSTLMMSNREALTNLWLMWLASLDDEQASLLKIDEIGEQLVACGLVHENNMLLLETPGQIAERQDAPLSTLNVSWDQAIPETQAIQILRAARKHAERVEGRLAGEFEKL